MTPSPDLIAERLRLAELKRARKAEKARRLTP